VIVAELLLTGGVDTDERRVGAMDWRVKKDEADDDGRLCTSRASQ
jgi:hypothetical protein